MKNMGSFIIEWYEYAHNDTKMNQARRVDKNHLPGV